MEIGKLLDNLDQETLIKALPIINEFLLKLNVKDYLLLSDELQKLANKKD